MDPVRLTNFSLDSSRLPHKIQMPTPAQLRELEAVVSESLAKLDGERAWEAVDDFLPDEHGLFLIGD